MFKIIKDGFSKRKRLAKKQPEILRYEELEQRVLFSADVVPGLDTAAVEEQVIVQDVGSDVQAEREAAPETVEQPSEVARSELVLVNENVTDYEQLIADLQGGDNNRIIEVVVLESDRDGIEQVSDILALRSDVAAVHFITHGSEGQINLGNSRLTGTTLQQNSDAISAWGEALTDNADILLYGCNIAASEAGQNLTETLSQLTGADVVASDDKTGHEDLGGDWELEYVSGSIETDSVLNEATQQEWEGLLAGETLLLSTTDNVASPSGAPGLDSWTSGEAIELGDPNLAFGEGTTDGTFSSIFNLDSFALDGSANIAGLHYVGTDITVAGITMTKGSLLLTTDGNEDLPGGVSVTNDDIFMFTPTTFGDYTSGTFTFLIDGSDIGSGGGATADTNGVSLIEQDVTVGGQALTKGTFIFAAQGFSGGDNKTIFTFEATSLGENSTTGSVGVLLSGNDVSISQTIIGVDIVEVATTVGDTTLQQGDILITQSTGDTVGDILPEITVAGQDIFILRPGIDITEGTAIAFLDGSSIGLDTSNETIGGLTLVPAVTANVAPVITSNGGGATAAINVVENTTAVTTVVATDADAGDTLTYSIDPASDDAAKFNINSTSGELSFVTAPDFEVPTDTGGNNVYDVTVQVDDGSGGTDSQAISVTVTNDLELVVTSASATGTGSLHQAILDANANVGVTDTITFNIAGAGPHTIAVDPAGLPIITDSVILDATTQSGYSGTPLITLDGSATPASSGINGITLRANDSTVKGFIVIKFADEGIEMDGSTGFGDNNIIQNNWVGIDAAGNVAGNAEHGIMISADASGNQIGGTGPNEGNVVAGNGFSGVIINENSDNNIVEGNIIGIKPDGTTPAGNGDHGILIQLSSDGNRIGGTTAGAGNIIAGNTLDGIYIDGTTDATFTTVSSGTIIQGNWIGTTGTGSTGVGNGNTGINVEGANTIIGGTGANEGNVITNNGNEGINVAGTGATGTIIQGNFIGLDPDGSTGSGNADVGIALLSGAHNTTIGGTTAAARNVISNNIEGIEINSNNNIVQGNYIGTDGGGTLDRGNHSDDGIEIKNGATGNLVGGTVAGAGNLIAFNALDGVNLVSGSGNSVIGNQIHSNSGLGIDLGTSGVTANDTGDADAGSNDLQNFPVITQAELSGTNQTLSGSIDTDGLNTQYRIEFFGNAVGTQDPTHGEGRYYLGTTTVTTNGSGDGTFSNVTLTDVSLNVGDYVTATATVIDNPAQVGIDDQLAYGSTSEFAANVAIVDSNTAPTTSGITDFSANEDFVSFINLYPHFADAEDADSALVYTIENNTNPALFDATTINASGVLTLDYAADQNGTADITIRATDTGGLYVETTFTVTVNPVNDAPTISVTNSTPTFTENGGAVSLFSDTSVDPVEAGDLIDTLQITVDSLADGNNEIIVVDGQNIELTHLNNETTATSGYDVSVSVSGTTATVVITKTGGFSAAAAETLINGVAYNNTSENPQGAVRMVTLISIKDDGGTTNGGADTKGIGISSLVTISAVNDDPTNIGSLPADVTVTEDVTSSVNLSAVIFSDVDAGTNLITVTLTTSTGGRIWASSDFDVIVSGSGTGTVTLIGGVADLNNFFSSASRVQYLHGTPHTEGDNADTIKVEINDGGNTGSGGGGTINLGTVNVDISAVNDAPAGTDNTVSTNEDTDYVFVAGDFGFGDPNDSPADNFANVIITTTVANGTLYVDANDDGLVDGGEAISDLDTVSVADITAGRLKFKPAANANGTGYDSFTFQVQDDGAGADTDLTPNTMTIDVAAVNDAPTITAIADQTIAEDGTTGALAFTVGDVETAAGSLTVTASSSNTTIIPNGNLTLVDLGSGNWTIAASPAPNQNGGPVTITVTVDDGTTTTDETFDITVTPDNDAPTITAIADQTIAEDGTTGALAFTVGDVETAAGSLTVTASSSNTTIIPNGNLTLIDLGSGNWTIEATPALNQNGGPVTITVTVDDGTTTTDETFDITVTPDNDAPTITAIADQTIAEDGTTGALAFTVGDVETSAGSLTVTASSSNTTIIPNGNLTLVDLGSGNWTIAASPAPNQNGGPVTITVTVDDGTTTTDETFDITVTPDNDAPTITAIADQTIAEDGTTGAMAFTVGDVETAAGSLTVTASSSNTTIIPDGNLTLVDLGSGNWTIEATPALNQNGGPVTITVTVDDGTTTTDETFDITVTPDNDAPTITAIADQTIAEDGTTGALAFTVGDVETAAGSLTVTASSSNTTIIPDGNLTLVDLGSGNWTIEATPALNQNGGPVTITVTVDDDTTTTDATFDITVTPDNDAPTITAITDQTIAEDGTTGALAFTVGDVETGAGSLTVTASSSNTTIIPNGNLTLVDLGSGNWTIAASPAPNQNGGPVTITVTVDDGTTTTDETFDITVTPDNDAPTITAIADQTIAEDGTTGALAFTVGDVETAAGSLTVTATSNNTTLIPNGNLTLVDLGSGNWTIEAVPATNQSGGPVTITVTVDDGTTTTDETFTVTVTADNDAPTISAIANQTIVEDGTTGALAFSVSDVETADGSLTVTATSSNTTLIPNGNLTLVDLGSGSWTIEATPALNQNGGPVTITVTVDDGTTTTDETFTVTVTADNDAPTISAIADQTIAEDGTTGALAFNVSDVETVAGSLTVTASSSNTTLIPNGNLTLVDLGSGSWTIEATPALNQNGEPVTITVTVDDGTTTTVETFDITVTPDNDAPTITAIADQTIAEDGTTGALTFSVGDVETAAGSLTVTANSSNTTLIPNGNLTLVDLGSGNWTIEATSALNQSGGPVTITVTVDDGTTTTDETFTVTVTADNDAPTISAIANQTIAEDGTTGALAFNVSDVETVAGSLTVTASSSNTTLIPNGNLTLVDLGSGSWTIEATPALNQNGEPVTITVTVDDGTTTTDETFDINVTPDNDTPTITAIADQTIVEDGTTGALAFTVGDVETAAGSLTVTASSSNTTLIPNGNLTLVDLGSGSWTIEATPALNQNGEPVTITVTVDDGTTTTDETFDINVTPDNDTPTITAIADQTIVEDGTTGALAFTVGDVETAAGSLTVTASSSNTTIIPDGNLTLVDLGSGNWSIAASPALNQSGGPVTITVTVDDGTATTDETFNVTVTANNDAPLINDVTFGLNENSTNGTAVGTVPVTDPDAGDTHVYSITAGNTSGAFAIDNAGNITVVNSAALDFETTPVFTLTVQVQDQGGTGLIDTATINVNLNNLNEAPISSGIANVTVGEDAPNTVIDLFAAFADTEDADASLTYTITANTNPGLFAATPIDGVAGTLTLDYAPNANGTANITVRATDTSALWVESTFTVTVNPVNDAPSTTPVNLTAISEDGGTRLITQAELLANAADVDGPALTATNLTISAGSGTLVDNGNGTWAYTPAANDDTSVSFTHTVTDGSLTAAGSATLDITPVNDAPVTNNDSATVDEGQNVVINLVGNDADVENALDLNSITITAAPTNGTLVDNGDGTLTYGHDGSKTISDRFSYTINDVSGATSNIAAVSLTVNPDNDNDPADSTDPNPTLEGPVTDEDEDSDVESPTYEAPGKDPLAEDEPLLLVEEYQAPEDSGDADESIVVMKDPQDEVTQDIVYLTDEIDRDAQPEGREDDRGYTYYDNDLYKDISLSKYLNFNGFAAENEPVAVSLDDISFLDFDSDDTDPVNLNEDYDLLRQEIDESFNSELESQGIKAKIVTATAATFTVGIVSYLLRAGSMVASMMSALPLWRGFDPIAIFSGNKKKKKKQDEISDAGELKPEAFFDGDAE